MVISHLTYTYKHIHILATYTIPSGSTLQMLKQHLKHDGKRLKWKVVSRLQMASHLADSQNAEWFHAWKC